jgi:Pyridoxamine 5'-phosphate oxidase
MTMVKGGTELLQDPVAQELLASRIPARLAYNWTDGTPRVVSIWFHWDGSDIVMASLPGAPKLKALQTGDRVAITIDTNDPPHHILSIRGTAEVTETQGVVKEYARAAVRYLGKEGARPTSGRCRLTSGWVASPCVLTMWWSWTSRPASRAR